MYVTNFWPEGCDKLSRDMDGIKKYYDEYTAGEYGEIDEQSFSDLNLDSIFDKMDGTYSSAGESKLYDMLRKPVRDRDVLESRNTFMEHFGEYTEDRIDAQEILYELSRDKKFNFLKLLNNDYKAEFLNYVSSISRQADGVEGCFKNKKCYKTFKVYWLPRTNSKWSI